MFTTSMIAVCTRLSHFIYPNLTAYSPAIYSNMLNVLGGV